MKCGRIEFRCLLVLVVLALGVPNEESTAATGRSFLAAGRYHTVGLEADGTVLAVGDNTYGQLNVSNWSEIVQVVAGSLHTVGLKADGTVVAAGWNEYGQLNVTNWSRIVQVAAGGNHTIALKDDGVVRAAGYGIDGALNVSDWTGIVQVATGDSHTVGLKTDGTVLAVGDNTYGQLNVSGWSGIVQVAAGYGHTVGLKADGTVVAAGWNEYSQIDVSDWTGITQIAAGSFHTVGLKNDGTVVAVGNNSYNKLNVSSWGGIVQVAAGLYDTLGLNADGTVVIVGDNYYGQLNVSGWQLAIPSQTTILDLNGDWKRDILWRNTTTGYVIVWYMSGVSVTGTDTLPYVDPASGWSIGGVGDFNGDGKPDILWRNTTTGYNAVWNMSGVSVTGTDMLPYLNPASGYSIAGVGDFNGDGKPDILWRNTTTGYNAVWNMSGTTVSGVEMLPYVDPTSGWSIGGVGDFNGDGRPDILWRNTTTGYNAVWYMNGATVIGTAMLPYLDPASGWTMVGH